MDLETANVARQIDHPADDWYPALTNKGRQIVFTSERDDDRNVLFQERFSDIYLEDISKAKLFRLTQNEADDSSPSVSATGKLIIFTFKQKRQFSDF